jgi:bacterioferritin-associated ferredoxin
VLVCHCKVVYERDVRAAIEAGARDEFDVADMCGAGTGCGSCVSSVTRILEEHCAPTCPVAAALQRDRETAAQP